MECRVMAAFVIMFIKSAWQTLVVKFHFWGSWKVLRGVGLPRLAFQITHVKCVAFDIWNWVYVCKSSPWLCFFSFWFISSLRNCLPWVAIGPKPSFGFHKFKVTFGESVKSQAAFYLQVQSNDYGVHASLQWEELEPAARRPTRQRLCTHSTDKRWSWPWILRFTSEGKHWSLRSGADGLGRGRGGGRGVAESEPALWRPATIIVRYSYWLVRALFLFFLLLAKRTPVYCLRYECARPVLISSKCPEELRTVVSSVFTVSRGNLSTLSTLSFLR